MGAILKAAMKVAGVAGSAAKTAAFGGTGARMGIGMAIGGLYGIVTNDYNDPEMAMGRVARLALYGGALGAASRLLTPAFKNGKFSGMPLAAKMAGSFAKTAPGMAASLFDNGMTAVGWSLRHPVMAGSIAAGSYAAYQYNKTPYSSSLAQSTVNQAFVDVDNSGMYNKMNNENEMLQRMSSGVSPMGLSSSGAQLRNQRMLQSTMGLTQGLHSGRHG